MTTTVEPMRSKTAATTDVVAAAPRVELTGISWETYESLLADRGDERWPRYTYDRGWLEIVSPRTSHDEDNRNLAQIVLIVVEELDMDVRNTGGFTYKGQALEAGFEPDSGFYLGREAEVRGKREIEGATDPPPDLVIEVDITHSSAAKLPLLARVGVNEIWRLTGGRVVILRRTEDATFEAADESGVFPGLLGLTSAVLNDFLASSRTMRWTDWVKSVRLWAREQIRSETT